MLLEIHQQSFSLPACLCINLPVSPHWNFSLYSTLYFISLIHSNNPLILGQDNSNVPRLLQIFTKVIEEDALVDSPETYDRVLNLCRHIQVRDVWMISDGVLMFILLVIRECMDCLYETINY